MKIKIVQASERDLDRFFHLFSKTLRADFPEYSKNTISYFLKEEFSKKQINNDLKKKKTRLYLAFLGKTIVGYLLAASSYGGVGFISWIAVDQKFRRKGAASALLNKWEEQSKKEGLHKVHLWTDKRNLEFYKKRGYVLVGRIPDNFMGAEDYLFYKTLQKSSEKNFLKDYLKKKA